MILPRDGYAWLKLHRVVWRVTSAALINSGTGVWETMIRGLTLHATYLEYLPILPASLVLTWA